MRISCSSPHSYVISGDNLTTRRFGSHLSDSFQWTLANIFLLHKITLVWLSVSQPCGCNFDHCLKPEFMTRWKWCVCQHMNMPEWYLHKLEQHLCQHMPPILKLNEQVIQMTYKVKWQQRDCQRLVCVSECSVPLTSGLCHLELFGEMLQSTYCKWQMKILPGLSWSLWLGLYAAHLDVPTQWICFRLSDKLWIKFHLLLGLIKIQVLLK